MEHLDRGNKVGSVSGKFTGNADQPVVGMDIDVYSVDGEKGHGEELNVQPDVVEPGATSDDNLDTLSTIDAASNLLFYDFLGNTTLHGIKYIYKKEYSYIRRLSWVCVMLASYIALLLTAKEHVTTYNSRMTKQEFSTTRRSSICFPAVTICNSNPIKSSIAENSTHNGTANVISSTFSGSIDKRGYDETDAALETGVDEIMLAYAHRATDMILECRWKNGVKACGAANFTAKMTDAGMCYTFNDGDFEVDDDNKSDACLDVNRSGSRQSLFVRLNAEVDEYVSEFSTGGFGFKASCINFYETFLLVHRRGDVPIVSDVGVAISPGFRTTIAIQKQTRRNLGHPFDTDCRDTPLDYYSFYSEWACLTEYDTKELSQVCGCRLPHMKGPAPMCTIRQYVECVLPNFEFETPNGTAAHCQRACYIEHFQMTMSYLKTPGKVEAQKLQGQFNWTEDDVMRNIAELEIYFADMNEHHTKSVAAYSLADLWGDLGGIIGVHMGASLLTLFEFLDYTFVEQIYTVLYIRFFWRKLKSFFCRAQTGKEASIDK
ncbi:acid-sensing ion channel 2-like [Lytechinus variegatus]|uniref:acid-sensing ion channel 2-like n=1 Tax=Lytechinus variegatus TaxID=7654 RepID=UPI001BB1D64C|nr:acid-sensing ion channel 2-like [Lytechinus variegatus]